MPGRGEALLLAIPLHVHLRHAVDDADTSVNARLSLAGRDASIVRLAGAGVGGVLGLRLEPRGGVNVGPIVGQRGVGLSPSRQDTLLMT